MQSNRSPRERIFRRLRSRSPVKDTNRVDSQKEESNNTESENGEQDRIFDSYQ